ncbi:MAG: cation:proton antiporter [Gaiellales bacterium]
MSIGDLNDLFLISIIAVLAPILVDIPHRIRIPVVVAELAGGILIGPYGLHWATENSLVVFLASFGLAMLFFMAGLELDFVRVRGRPLTLGVAGWLLSLGIAIGIAAGLQAAGFIISARFVGVALSTTAIGTLLPVMRDRGELATPFGTLVIGAGVAGEFGPIVMISLLFGNSANRGVTTALLAAFTLIALAAALLALRARPPRLVRVVEDTMEASGQLAVRGSILILVGLVYLASEFGLDVILGAFASGTVVGAIARGPEARGFLAKMDAVAFGLLIPIFFISSGMGFDIGSVFTDPKVYLRLPVFLALFLIIRGIPTLFYSELTDRDKLGLAFYSATCLPLVVAITEIGTRTGKMHDYTATALVGAAMVSVLTFPLLAKAVRPAAA